MKLQINERFFPNELTCCSSVTGYLNICILKLKKHDFAGLIFFCKKFQKMGTKSLSLSFQKSFSACYFPISQESLNQNSSLTPLLE